MEEYIRHAKAFLRRLDQSHLPDREEVYFLFRMAGPIMQAKLHKHVDLSRTPVTFLHGNPHVDNYCRTHRGSAMIDFDRARMGPYCWDIIRFLSSLCVRSNNDSDPFLHPRVIEHFIDSYLMCFLNQELPSRSLKLLRPVKPEKWQTSMNEYLKAGKKWAKKMREHPLNPRSDFATGLLQTYLKSRNSEILNEYKVSEVGAAPGSFGKKHYIYALVPKDPESHSDSILLDIKEVYEEKDSKFFFNPFPHNGLRMIEASKIYAPGMEQRLGYCSYKNVEYWGREIPAFAVKVKKFLNKEEQCDFAHAVGSELGKGHFRGLKNPADALLIEKDFTRNFDHYVKVATYLTYELHLAYAAIRKMGELDRAYRSW